MKKVLLPNSRLLERGRDSNTEALVLIDIKVVVVVVIAVVVIMSTVLVQYVRLYPSVPTRVHTLVLLHTMCASYYLRSSMLLIQRSTTGIIITLTDSYRGVMSETRETATGILGNRKYSIPRQCEPTVTRMPIQIISVL